MMGRARAARRNEAGAIAIVVAICSVILFLLAALVVDLGLARDTRRQSQNASDASALAAVNALYPTSGTCTSANPGGGTTSPCFTDALDAAKSYATVNFGVTSALWAGCADGAKFWTPPGSTACISFTDDTLTTSKPAKPTKVRVLMPGRSVATPFRSLAGISHVDIGSSARATIVAGGRSSCGLCLLGSGNHVIQNGDVAVDGTSVQANGNLSTQQNNGHVNVTNGTVSVQGTATGNITPAAQTGAGVLTDPLANVTIPGPGNSWSGLTPTSLKGSICSQGPGFYHSPSIANNCVLQPGLYVITGSLDLSGQKSINATAGVTLFFACGTSTPVACAGGGQAGAGMTFAGQATLSIHPPTTGPTAGFSIISDRNNTSDIELRGNGAGTVTGTIYAASGALGFRGNGAGAAIDSLVVVNDLVFKGNPSTFSLVYNDSSNVQLPPGSPALDR
jgi:Flp pilus assembly protein TadG